MSKTLKMGKKYLEQFYSASWLPHLLIVILLLLSVLIILDQANPLTTSIGRDSGVYLFVSSYLLRGQTLYALAWESKPPGIFLIDALGLWLGKGTRWGIWGMEFIFLFTAAIASFYTLKKRFGIGTAALATLLWLSGLTLILRGGNFTEEYSLSLNFLCLFFFSIFLTEESLLWASVLTGIFTGFSFLIRPNNIGVQASIVLSMILLYLLRQIRKRSFIHIIGIGVGFLIPIAGVVYYFISRNAFQLFLDASFIYNFSYSSGHLNLLDTLVSGIINLGFVSGIMLVGLWISAGNLRSQFKTRKFDPLLVWLCIDFIVDVTLSGISGRGYEHYFINWLPMVAVSSAFLVERIMPAIKGWSQKSTISVLLITVLVVTISNLDILRGYWNDFLHLESNRSSVQKIDPISEYINKHTQPNETVLVWGGQVGITFLAKRDTPSRYLFYPLYIPSGFTDRITSEYYQSITSKPPALIIDGSYFVPEEVIPLSVPSPQKWLKEHNVYNTPHLEEFLAFFRRNYSYETTVNGAPIYRYNRSQNIHGQLGFASQ